MHHCRVRIVHQTFRLCCRLSVVIDDLFAGAFMLNSLNCLVFTVKVFMHLIRLNLVSHIVECITKLLVVILLFFMLTVQYML